MQWEQAEHNVYCDLSESVGDYERGTSLLVVASGSATLRQFMQVAECNQPVRTEAELPMPLAPT